MRKSPIVLLIILISILVAVQCTDDAAKKKPRFTMAEDSELTLLMRDMYDYYDSLKVSIENGNLEGEIRTFVDIHSAISTEPEKAQSPLYKAMAEVYLASSKRLNDPTKDRKQSFNLMIENCMNCHQQMCPGPMVKIKKLYVDVD